MGKYRAKPVDVEVFKVTKEGLRCGTPSWVASIAKTHGRDFYRKEAIYSVGPEQDSKLYFEIASRQRTIIEWGDWLVKEGDSVKLVPADIFEATYEPVEDQS